jgi:hypothetical protein
MTDEKLQTSNESTENKEIQGVGVQDSLTMENNPQEQDSNLPLMETIPSDAFPEVVTPPAEPHEEELEMVAVDSALSKESVHARLKELLEASKENFGKALAESNALKQVFKNKIREEREHFRLQQVESEQEGEPIPFQFSAIDNEIQQLFQQFDAKRKELRQQKELDQKKNAEKRKAILDELKVLVENFDSGESTLINLKEGFEKIHQLQEKWRNSGMVEASAVLDLNNSYKFYMDKFYEFVRLNQELREYDYKKNLVIKTELVNKAEDLKDEESIRKSIDGYKQLKEQWMEAGPVHPDLKDTLWDRFKMAGDAVFNRLTEYNEEQKKHSEEFLAKKTELIQEMTVAIESWPDNHNGWQKLSEKVNEIFERWKAVGFLPSKENEDIWNVFKAKRDEFFKAKEDFYDNLKKVHQENLKIKNDLVAQAEAVKESTDWKKTADLLKRLQENWKKSGPVQHKHSEKLWQRFRAACDAFFENKKLHFAEQDASNGENLALKEALIERINQYQPKEDPNITFEELRAFQNEWLTLGHVPFKEKERIGAAYKSALDKHFDGLRASHAERNKTYAENKFVSLINSPGGKNRVADEIYSLQDKIKRKESEASTLENNIGFFARSKGAEAMIKDTERKIQGIKDEIKKLKDQIRVARDLVQPKAPAAPKQEVPTAE